MGHCWNLRIILNSLEEPHEICLSDAIAINGLNWQGTSSTRDFFLENVEVSASTRTFDVPV
jgi:hypothetical protein